MPRSFALFLVICISLTKEFGGCFPISSIVSSKALSNASKENEFDDGTCKEAVMKND